MNIIKRSDAKKLGLKRYFTGRKCKSGHISDRTVNSGSCRTCNKNGRINNKERIKKYNTDYYVSHKDEAKAYKELHKDRIKARSRIYSKENALSVFIRGSISRILTNWRGSRAKGEKLCGYTVGQLKHHLESLFVEGMNWDNRREWHIDHIKPLSLFIKEGVTDPAIINALSNLQPLWARDNRVKWATYVYEGDL